MRLAPTRRRPALLAVALVTIGVATLGAIGGRATAASAPAAWVIGYYPWYEAAEVPPAAFPYRSVTHVAIGDLRVTDGTCCTLPDGSADTWRTFAPAVVSRAHAAGTKVLLQLGGAGDPAAGWRAGTATPAATDRLARSIVAYARKNTADGVALDWEQEVDERAVGRLAKRLRALWPAAAITFDIDPYDEDLGWVPQVAPYVDRIDAMTYVSVGDWGGWDGPWHQGALLGDGETHPFSVDRKVRSLRAAGVPARKIGIGIGLYGTGYGDANGDGRCPVSATGGWAGEVGPRVVDFDLQLDDIERLYAPFMTRAFDPVTRTPTLSAPAPGVGGEADGWPPRLCYITYEDAQSAKAKGAYVRARGLGAVILWAVPQDRRPDGSYPVLRALAAGLGR